MKETTTIKIYRETLPKLRLLSALRGERMVKLVYRVISQELKKEGGKNDQERRAKNWSTDLDLMT